ncbi:MAG: DUF2892 domain-containing protein [Chthoniobacterales bacterium]
MKNKSCAASVNINSKERILSAIGGIILTLHGLRQRSVSRMLWTTIGGALMTRGFTGHCSAYEALGIHTADSRKTIVDKSY